MANRAVEKRVKHGESWCKHKRPPGKKIANKKIRQRDKKKDERDGREQ